MAKCECGIVPYDCFKPCKEPKEMDDVTVSQIWRDADKREKDWREAGEKVHLDAMHTAFCALKACGWREAIYCPKDGTRFLAIEAGSTGIFPCRYEGDWPNGLWWTEAHGDLWPSRPILWKPMP